MTDINTVLNILNNIDNAEGFINSVLSSIMSQNIDPSSWQGIIALALQTIRQLVSSASVTLTYQQICAVIAYVLTQYLMSRSVAVTEISSILSYIDPTVALIIDAEQGLYQVTNGCSCFAGLFTWLKNL